MARSRLSESQVLDADFMSEDEYIARSTTMSGHLCDQMVSISGTLQLQIDDNSFVFNPTNFTVSGTSVNTIQDISSTASPTFSSMILSTTSAYISMAGSANTYIVMYGSGADENSKYNQFINVGNGTTQLRALNDIGTIKRYLMHWDHDTGRVGVNTSTPSTKVDIVGDGGVDSAISLTNTDGTDYCYLGLTSSGSTGSLYNFGSTYSTSGAYEASATVLEGYASGGINIIATNVDGDIKLFTGGHNERMAIDKDGIVSIQQQLEVNKDQIGTGYVQVFGAADSASRYYCYEDSTNYTLVGRYHSTTGNANKFFIEHRVGDAWVGNIVINTDGSISMSKGLSIGNNEVTCGSINRASDTFSIKIGGSAIQDITSDDVTFNEPVTTHNGVFITTSGTYVGETFDVTVDDASASFGNVLYCASDFHYERADASSSSTMPCTFIALEAGTGTKKVLKRGQICDTSWNWSAGPLYVSTTTGGITQTAPSSTGDQVQIIGFALSADTIYFNPNLTIAEVA
jgi:hypothetical protein